MKVYLRDNDWKLYEGTKKDLKPEFDKRGITIGKGARIGTMVLFNKHDMSKEALKKHI